MTPHEWLMQAYEERLNRFMYFGVEIRTPNPSFRKLFELIDDHPEDGKFCSKCTMSDADIRKEKTHVKYVMERFGVTQEDIECSIQRVHP